MISDSRLFRLIIMSVLPVLILVLWEAVVRMHLASTFLLPSLGQVAVRLWQDLQSGEIVRSAADTIMRLAISYIIAAVLGVALGVMMSRIRFARWLLDPLISVAYPTPKISFLPILVLWLGVFDKPKITICALSCIFPIIAWTWAGTQSVDKYLLWSAENLGTHRQLLLWKVVLPASLPQIFTALQIALPIAFITIIVAEMLTGGGGLGGTMMESARLADPAGVFSNLLVIALLGYLAMKGIEFARRKTLVWHEEVQRQGSLI